MTDQVGCAIRHLRYWTKHKPSEVGIRVAELLEEWDGLHHFDQSAMKKAEWHNPSYILLTIQVQLSTFDFNALTRLVFLAHDHCIRVDIKPCNGTHLKIMFHPRNVREGGMCSRHPTLEDAVLEWRKNHVSKKLENYARKINENSF